VQSRGSGEETIQPDAVNIHLHPLKLFPKNNKSLNHHLSQINKIKQYEKVSVLTIAIIGLTVAFGKATHKLLLKESGCNCRK
jgi:hypothetical protein